LDRWSDLNGCGDYWGRVVWGAGAGGKVKEANGGVTPKEWLGIK